MYYFFAVLFLAFSAAPAFTDNKTNTEVPPVAALSPEHVKEGRALNNFSESALDDVTMEEEMLCHEGEIIKHGCDEICRCQEGKLECRSRCSEPLIRSTLTNQDPHCFLKSEDECCSKLICSQSNFKDAVLAEKCEHNNLTYKIGETFEIGCTSVCQCISSGDVMCRPRCPLTNTTNSDSDRCLTVQDKKDHCCTILYCDVNESDDTALDEEGEEDVEINLVSAVPANNSAVILNFDSSLVPERIRAEISQDKVSWFTAKTAGHVVQDLSSGKTYYFRVVGHTGVSNIVSSTLPEMSQNSSMCEYKGKTYQKGLEFYDGCIAYCVCAEQGVECATFKCPTYFGLDVLDPQCLQWESRPADFKPEPPHCCPDSVVCVNNGSCTYKGEMFENWADIPSKLSGCDMKCYCQTGNVTCSARCSPVPATPPLDLRCAPNAVPIVSHPPDDNCCLHWMCPSNSGMNSNSTQLMTNTTNNIVTPSVPFLGPYSPNFLFNKTKMLETKILENFPIEEKIVLHALNTQNNSLLIPNKPAQTNNSKDGITLNQKETNQNTNSKNPSNLPIENPTIQKDSDSYYKLQATRTNNKNSFIEVSKEKPHKEEEHLINFEPSLINTNNHSIYNHIPIGVINLDNLPTNDEHDNKFGMADHNINPSLFEHLLEYHHYQETLNAKNKSQSEQLPMPQHPHNYQVNNIDGIGKNPPTPHSPQFSTHLKHPLQYVPHQNIHFNSRPFEPTKHVQNQNNFNEFDLYQQQKPELPHYATVYNNLHNSQFHPPKTLIPHPHSNPQYVSPEELYLVESKDKILPLTKQTGHPYLTGHRNDANVHDHSTHLGLKLEDIIDNIKQHEETDSHASDVHVLLLQPQNYGQEVLQRPTPGLPTHPSHEKNAITVHTLEAVDEETVRLVFSVPNVLVGLHGRVELRYTADNKNSDPATWEQKVLAPPDDLIATPELEFNLQPLQPDTEYKIKITVVMRDLQNSPASQILTVRTPPASQPPVIHVDPELHVVNVNSTSATLSWRNFKEIELQFIDGVQLRYKEIDGKVYQATPLIHRAVTSYRIEDLKPESQYEIGIFLIPFPGQATELQAQKTVQLSTTVENDPYKFELILDIHHIKSASVEVTWSGVPYPEDKYVNIFRAIYQYEGGREDMNSFKVAKRDSPAGTLIQGLKPDTRYRLWIEAYLTNGKIKKSNVKDFITKKGSGSPLNPNQGKLEGASLAEVNDYYGPFVAVSILAAIAVLVAAGLLVILARKHGHNKAPITTAVQRKSLPHTAAYDNPSYKTCEGDPVNGGRSSHAFDDP